MKGQSLGGQRVLITGVSRPGGIGWALARRFAQAGARVAAHGHGAYDVQMAYPDAQAGLGQDAVRGLHHLLPSDLSLPGEPERIVQAAAEMLGGLDGLILNHAYSVNAPIGEWTAAHIDAHLLINVRASMLILQAFAAQAKGGGCVTLFTSGQYLGPMTQEIAYAVSKEALRGLCGQAAAALAPRGIRVNCVNPGPVDTGYLTGEAHAAVAGRFPAGRWGTPEDTADLVQFLHSAQAGWITGQTIASEGGFVR